jgi:hypothetical protein
MFDDSYRPSKKDLDLTWDLTVAHFASKDARPTDAEDEFIALVQTAFYISPTGNMWDVNNCGTAATIGEARQALKEITK